MQGLLFCKLPLILFTNTVLYIIKASIPFNIPKILPYFSSVILSVAKHQSWLDHSFKDDKWQVPSYKASAYLFPINIHILDK